MKLLLTLVLFAIAAVAQNERRVVELQHIDANDLGTSLANLVRTDTDASRRLVVLLGSPEGITAAEAIIKKLDQPKKTIELTFFLLTAIPASTDSKLPSVLEPVVKQLRSSFTYADYQLLDTVFVRTREGSGFETVGVLDKAQYRIQANRPVLVQAVGAKPQVQSENLLFVLTSGTNSAQITAPLNLQEGQRVVIGKSTSAAVGGAVFLVATAEVVD
jgi:hypothetical protein